MKLTSIEFIPFIDMDIQKAKSSMYISNWIIVLCVTLMVPAYAAADDTECTLPKPIDCYNCDSREQHFCNDKFNKTDAVSLRHMKKCEGECLKWVRQVDPTDPDTEWYVMRMCKKDVAIEMYLSPDMCIGESRPGSGKMCTCQADRCNSAHSFMLRSSNLLLYAYIILAYAFVKL